MFVRISSRLAVTMLLMSIWFCGFNIQPARADGPVYIGTDGSVEPSAMVGLVPSENSVLVDATFTVNVTIINVTDMYTWQIELFFDPKVLNCTSAWYPDDHVFAGKEIVSVNPVIDNTEGSVLYGCCLLGTAQENFDGNGTLCQIQFIGVSPGESSLIFSGPEDTFLLDHNLNKMPYGTLYGNAIVEGELNCDLNNDQKINIADISEAAIAFGSYPSHQRWNPAADINRDDKVDIIDLFLIARSFTQ